MIGLLLPLLARWGVAERLRRPLAIAALVISAALLAGGAWAAWLHFHDAGVVERHETKRELEEATEALDRQRSADDNAAPRDRARAAAAAQTQDELETIHAENPAAAAAPASRGTRAVAKRLPLQP